VTLGDRTIEGFSRNLSETAIYLLLPAEVDPHELAVGRAIRLRIELPDGSLAECPAEIAWTDVNDRDVDGSRAIGVGATLELSDARYGDQLREFIYKFRYVVLVAGGSDAERGRITTCLSQEYDVVAASGAVDVLACLEHREVTVLILAPTADGISPGDLLDRLSARYPRSHATRIVLSRTSTVEEMRTLINRGRIFHSLDVDVASDALVEAVRAAVDRYALAAENERAAGELERTKRWLERENAFLRQRLTGVSGFDKIIGNSQQLRDALGHLQQICRTDASVHIQGETGTGKELVARALHVGGPRADHPYVVQNCAGMTDTLLQSTLFGHRKGAFTGADRDHRGLFLEADGGTLFLDEVGELSPATQGMLLRALQGEVTPVGANRPLRVDTRIISATNRNLREEVNAGRFREDLFYRLVVVTVRLPPLRDREGDVALLARHFLDMHCEHHAKDVPGFRTEAIAALEAYPWPGNVRELDNEIERVVILADAGEKIGVAMLSPHIVAQQRNGRAAEQVRSARPRLDIDTADYDAAVRQFERTLVAHAISAEGGSITRAAKRIGIERTRLGKIRKRLGI
jgi:two-component system response regulator HupR/HoxA